MDEAYLRAGNPGTPSGELRDIYAGGIERLLLRLAENTSTPIDLLERLSCHDNEEIRAAAVTNPNAPPSVLQTALCDRSVFVRYELAECPNIDERILEQLCEDENPYVRDQAERTMAGLALEKALKSCAWEPEPGNWQRLGELLSSAGFVSEKQIEEFLNIAEQCKRPLGRILVQCRVLHHSIIVEALQLQSQIRRRELSAEEAVHRLKQNHQYQPKAS